MTKDTLSISWTLNDDVKTIIDRIIVAAEKQDQSNGSNSTPCRVGTSNVTAQCGDLTPGCTYKVTVAVEVGPSRGSNSTEMNMGKYSYFVFPVVIVELFRIF